MRTALAPLPGRVLWNAQGSGGALRDRRPVAGNPSGWLRDCRRSGEPRRRGHLRL